MGALGAQVALVLLGWARRQAAPSRDGDLVLARDLRVQSRFSSAAGESSPELALLKVCNGILSIGNVFGEEVVEVVRDERVPDTAGVTEAGEDGEPEKELAEDASLLLGLGLDWVGGYARRSGAGGRCCLWRYGGRIARGCGSHGAVGGGRCFGHVRGLDGALADGGRVGGRCGGCRVGDGRLAQVLLIVCVEALGDVPLRAGGADQWAGSWTGP